MAYQSYQTVYTAETSFPVLVTDSDTGLELDCSLNVVAKFKLKPYFESGYKKTIPEADRLREVAADELKLAYLVLLPDGVPMSVIEAGKPDEVFNANAGGRLRVRFNIAFGVSLDNLTIERHYLNAEDSARIAEMREMKRLSDPKVAAEEMLRRTEELVAAEEMRRRSDAVMEAACRTPGPDGPMHVSYPNPEFFKKSVNPKPEQNGAAEWICACGSVNRLGFCPECGKPRSYANWRCSCGTVNDDRFCTQCGNKRPE